ncbi:hypothetical protein ACHAXH_000738 [Discostella pseudostelligera]
MSMPTNDDNKQSIILEGVAWKRRGGFGKFSDTVGAGSSWQRRRIALTAKGLSYYNASGDNDTNDDSSSSKSVVGDTPRGTLSILPDHATITATYPGDSSQPTPYALAVKTTDSISNTEITKWKLCFDNREQQLLWLVALTDIVAEVSVKEFNARVLSTKYEHGGFHRLYEEGNGKLLHVIQNAIRTEKLKSAQMKGQGEGIEIVHRSTKKFHVMADSFVLPSKEKLPPEIDLCHGNKLYQAMAVILVSIVYEKFAKKSSSPLSILINVIILCICFAPTKSNRPEKEVVVDGESKAVKEELDSTLDKPASLNETDATTTNTDDDNPEVFESIPFTKSMVGTELMKAQGVPLSDIPSQSFHDVEEDTEDEEPKLHRPLTTDEMRAHAHERWAMSAPNVDLSGEWTLVADEKFKQEYDTYLKQLGFNGISRRVACSLIGRTTEVTKQYDNGRKLYLKGTNPKGAWERTLTASGYPDFQTEQDDFLHLKTSIKTADSEDVSAECWWEETGTKHRSWLRGGSKYGGGDHESLRYLDESSNGNVLVCESTFHPKDASKKRACVTWRFRRN